ncbi:MAG TPA: PilZ domain-containing protein [Sedimentisphaerales bacterium]|nr:PilZ domain-containing protein [Sedimentisphaerales bacterium]
MNEHAERRTEKRLRYYWPIWFAENFDDALAQGQMVDLSSRGAAFTCYADQTCPDLGRHITARFSVPRYGPDGSFDMADFTRSAHICRIQNVNPFLRRVAVQFAEALPFKPGEQQTEHADADPSETLEPARV